LRSEFITALSVVCAAAGSGAAPNMPPTLAATANAAKDFLTSNMAVPFLLPVFAFARTEPPGRVTAADSPKVLCQLPKVTLKIMGESHPTTIP
jgi:hypothetical protein